MTDHPYRRRRANLAAGPVPEGGREPNELRRRRVVLSVSDSEYGRLKDRADAASMSVPRLLLTQHEGRMPAEAMAVRGRLLDLTDELAEAHKQVRMVGNNLNQLVLLVRRGGAAEPSEIEATQNQIRLTLARLAMIAERVDEAAGSVT